MNLGILISGRGSNMVSIVDSVNRGEIAGAKVVVVISDKPDAPGLEKARERGVEALVIERRGRPREEHDAEIVSELKSRDVELVCLAGYMSLLSKGFVAEFPNRILNIHPSLLPAYPGLRVHERVLEAAEKWSGCTVHYVNEELDAGEIVMQRRVPVLEGDTPGTLAARILLEENKLYVDAIKDVICRMDQLRSTAEVSV
jgi:phosphoribosylglycinamide formyltransferase 1